MTFQPIYSANVLLRRDSSYRLRDGAVVYDLNAIAGEAWEKMAPPAPRRQAPPPQ